MLTRLISAAATGLALTVTLGAPTGASAQEKYLGEIFMGGWNFCPRGSAPAAGQLLAISSNSALFSLLGTQFGGDGRTTFGLPDLRGRVAVNAGQGPGLSSYRVGQSGGTETRVLSINEMPAHSHPAEGTVQVSTQDGNNSNPAGHVLADDGNDRAYRDIAPDAAARANNVSVTVGNVGGGQPVDIRQPMLALTYCITTQGIFPSRS